MKKIILATLMGLSAGIATAAPFDFEKAWGSPDLDPTLDDPTFEFAPVTRPGPAVTSLDHIYRGNPDGGVHERHWEGVFIPSAPFAISLFEIYRGNPDGSGHAGYYERYPLDTDWDALAREHDRRLKADGYLAQNEG